MAGFDSLIGPFASVDVTYPRRITNAGATPPANVVLKVGDSSGVKSLAYSRSYSLTTYMEKKQREIEVPPEQVPDGRQRHVKRIPGKTRDERGVVTNVPGTWMDVERYDLITTQEGSGIDYQKTHIKPKWYLDENGEVPNPARKTREIEIPADPDNPNDLFFVVEVNDAIVVREFDQDIKRRFDNKADNNRRRDDAQIRRIKHYDTPHDDDPTLEENGGVIRDYRKDLDTKDDDQYLDVEIPGSFVFDDYQQKRHLLPNVEFWQRTTVKLNNGYLVDASDVPDKSYGEGDINPPARLDPLQNIVNVKTKAIDQQWLVGTRTGGNINGSLEFPNPGDPDIEGFNTRVLSGTSWSDTICATSGLGLTVISRGPIGFGTIKTSDGKLQRAFLRADMNNEPGNSSSVHLGTMVDGSLVWETVWTAPLGIQAIAYANDRFFVTYFDGGDPALTSRLAITRDGRAFTTGVNPFPSVPVNPINGQSNIGGNVAWNKATERYAIIGSVLVGGDDNSNSSMCWGTSRDGIAWTSGYAADPYQQPGQNFDVKVTSLSAGNGVFVAAASFKNRFPSPDTLVRDEDGNEVLVHHDDYVLPQCGVAVSADGIIWSTGILPGSVVRSSEEEGDRAGNTYAVAFIRDKDSNAPGGINGYFVAAGLESGGVEGTQTAKLWKSSASAGLGWSLIRSDDGPIFHGAAFIALSAVDKKFKTIVTA
jgi:hypothetical protein